PSATWRSRDSRPRCRHTRQAWLSRSRATWHCYPSRLEPHSSRRPGQDGDAPEPFVTSRDEKDSELFADLDREPVLIFKVPQRHASAMDEEDGRESGPEPRWAVDAGGHSIAAGRPRHKRSSVTHVCAAEIASVISATISASTRRRSVRSEMALIPPGRV